MAPVVAVDNLSFSYGTAPVLQELDLSVNAGEVVCLRTAHWLRVADLRSGAECGTVCPVRATTRPEMSLLLSRRGGA